MSNLYTVYRNAVKQLSQSGCESPEFDARCFIEHCFGLNNTGFLLKAQSQADENKLLFFEDCIKRRCNKEPLQYIIGEWDFYKYTFKVKPGVLIPRPETELIVEYAINNFTKSYGGVIYDLCCGSGCIGISVAKQFPMCKVFCIDISDEAVSLTEENKDRLEAYNVTVVKADLFEGFSALSLPQPDVILSNPPYIASDEIDGLQEEVKFEPRLALDGGPDGLKFYRVIAEKWFPYIRKGGFCVCECGEMQARNILNIYLNIADNADIIKDASGTERVVVTGR